MEFNKFNTTGAQNIKFYLWYETKIISKYVLVWKVKILQDINSIVLGVTL